MTIDQLKKFIRPNIRNEMHHKKGYCSKDIEKEI